MLVMTVMLAASVQQLTEEYLRENFRYSPTTASQVGYHKDGVDRKLDDISASARKKRVAYLRGLSKRLAALDRGRLQPDDRADARLLDENIALELLELEKAHDFARRADLYMDGLGTIFFNMAVREYAPLDTRAADVAARLRELPRFLAQAQKNLDTFVEPFREAALDDGKGLLGFLQSDLPKAFEKSAGKPQIDAALPAALKAVEAYLKFCEGPLQKLKKGDFRYGKELYGERFGHYLQTDLAPDETLALAEKRLAEIRADMVRLAGPLFQKNHPGRARPDGDTLVKAVLDDIAKEHSTPEQLFQDAKDDVAREREFIRRRGLLTLPPTETIKVIETPPFLRSFYGVAAFDGAPPLQPELGAFFYVTPFPRDWPREKAESKLREYNKWKMELLAIHEAMPGHYVQYQIANQIQPEYRRVARWLLSSGAYVEGWAVFTEDLMTSSGYLDDPRMKLSFEKGILRVVANTMLDIRLHTRDMSDAEAMKLMVDSTFQEKTEAELKLRRAKLSVTQLCTYFVGYEEWRSIRDAAKKAQGKAFVERAFLDRALRYGGVALPSLRELMLGTGGGADKAPASP